MDAARLVRAFGPIDARNVRRDSMLRWFAVLPLLLALGIRLIIPIVIERLGAILKLDLMPYYHVIGSYVLLLITPILYGMVIGSLFLDQRDDGTLTALQVTPVSLRAYMAYRLSLPVVVGAIATLGAFAVAGVSDIGPLPLALCVLTSTPLAALAALALACFAENKVQGFALQKAGSVFLLPPLVAYFLPAQWQPLFALLPTYWPTRLYSAFQAGDPYWWAYLLAGLLYQALLLFLLLRRFEKVTSR